MKDTGSRPITGLLTAFIFLAKKSLLSLLCEQALAVLVFTLMAACSPKENRELDHNLSATHSFSPSVSLADQKRNAGEYQQAYELYDSLAKVLGPAEQVYASINRELCRFLANDTITVLSMERLPETVTIAQKVSEGLLLGVFETRNGRSGLKSFYQAGALLRSDDKRETFEYFAMLEQLAWCHQMVHGETDSSYFYYKKALDMAGDFEELSPHIPRLLVQLSEVAITNRDFVAALGYTEDGLRQKPHNKDLHELLILKATLMRRMEKFDSATYYYQLADEKVQLQADTASLAKLLRERALHEMIVNNDSLFRLQMMRLESLPAHFASNAWISTDRLYGFYHFLRGDAQASIDAYERAVAHFSRQKLPDIVQTTEAFWVLSYLYRQLGQYDKAEKNIFAGIVYFSPYKNAPFSWEVVTSPEVSNRGFNFVNYQQLAEIELQRYKDRSSDQESLRRSFEIYQLIDSLMFQQIRAVEEDALLMFLRIGRMVYSGAIEASFHLHQLTQDTAFLNQAHMYMERSKGLITYQDLLARNQEYFSEVPEEFRTTELQLKAQIAAMKRSYAYDSREMTALLRKADDYYADMQDKYPNYYKAKYQINPESYAHYADMADAREATFVQYFVNDDYVYALSYGGEGRFERVEVDAPFTTALNVLETQLAKLPNRQGGAAKEAFMESSALLYNKLLRPLGNIQKSLLVIPDGALAYLPFEVLATEVAVSFRDAPYLIKTCEVNYAPSLQIYALNQGKKGLPTDEVVAYSFTKPLGELDALPGTKREVALLAKVFSGSDVQVRTNEEVTRQRLIDDMVAAGDIIHLGLHASSSLADKLENKIDCYSPTGLDQDALYGYEIAPLSIKAHTVVLTACQSAFGPVVEGEGTYSLARAFKQAGVANVVASLWNLSDGTTSTLVGSFYEGLSQGKSAATSLSLAKRKYLKEADELMAHPHFWSGLVCQGQ
ncbi:CHAT domain-containing tetratricopeptide repeat protein [Imperialibacter sp.]|uniref:CHAT domain-containing protein n=1 Tax=Imperialibacter sp. TaxID=2038411 RepID=UPI0032F00785